MNKFGLRRAFSPPYHDNSDGWYLILPDDWKDNVTVKRDEYGFR
jgi:hypothetical protein